METQYIPVNKEQIPYRFEIRLGAELFTFEVRYNADFDFFTIDLEKDREVLVYGEKVVYGVPLFHDIEDFRYPVTLITPSDLSGQEEQVAFDNLGDTVFLVVGS